MRRGGRRREARLCRAGGGVRYFEPIAAAAVVTCPARGSAHRSTTRRRAWSCSWIFRGCRTRVGLAHPRARCYDHCPDAGWSSPVARWAHNPKVAGSNPAPATTFRRDTRRLPAGLPHVRRYRRDGRFLSRILSFATTSDTQRRTGRARRRHRERQRSGTVHIPVVFHTAPRGSPPARTASLKTRASSSADVQTN